jgi:carboxypeptidase Q
MKRTVLLFCLLPLMAFPQGKNDSILIRSLFTEVLTNGKCYQNLEYLCKKIGSRMSGTREAQLAVEYTGKLMREM